MAASPPTRRSTWCSTRTTPRRCCAWWRSCSPPRAVPRSLSDSLSRAGDLAFGNQTQRILEGQGRALRLRAALQAVAERLPAGLRADPALAPALAAAAGPGAATVVRLGYHATPEDAGPGKLFDFSADSLARRWRAGEAGLRAALRLLEGAPPAAPGLTVHEVAA
ncbi:DUF3734 domain-containing protein [Teichococcus aestuarii]|uniref:DUF3734 domain-containing protein n=1 Tax=Teichococcus aestuarii TaxID=568898 RepID=UPI0036108BA8